MTTAHIDRIPCNRCGRLKHEGSGWQETSRSSRYGREFAHDTCPEKVCKETVTTSVLKEWTDDIAVLRLEEDGLSAFKGDGPTPAAQLGQTIYAASAEMYAVERNILVLHRGSIATRPPRTLRSDAPSFGTMQSFWASIPAFGGASGAPVLMHRGNAEGEVALVGIVSKKQTRPIREPTNKVLDKMLDKMRFKVHAGFVSCVSILYAWSLIDERFSGR